MKISKFLKDLFTTGFSQIGVVLFGVLVLKIMAAVLSQENFGLFILIRRWMAVLLPMVTLNLSIGLTRYVSCEKEKAKFYLHISLITAIALCFLIFIFLSQFNKTLSVIFFKSANYSSLVLILAFFLFANAVHLITYSYFRGKLNMNAANVLRTFFSGFPVLLGLAVLLMDINDHSTVLYLYFSIYSLWGVVTSLYFLRKEFFLPILKNIFKNRLTFNLKESRSLFLFGLIRIPSVFFISLTFGFPVFIAAHKISVEAAGYMGIVVAVLRLFGSLFMPFNMIFLPKFSSLKKNQEMRNIKHYSLVVLNFIFTFLPIFVVMIYGLSRFLILIWFGTTYLTTANGVAAMLFFAMFYLSFALIRGILDGLFVFPFNNVISLAGFSTTAALSLIFALTGPDVLKLSIAFGSGLFTLGVVSILVLVKKLDLSIEWNVGLKTLVSAGVIFLILKYIDGILTGFNLKSLYSFVICVSCRIILFLIVWYFYWRKTLWYIEMTKRVRFKRFFREEL